MEPAPYEIKDEDIDEVLDAYEPTGGGRFPEDARRTIRAHVLSHVIELDETIRVAPEEDEVAGTREGELRASPADERPGNQSSARREMALGAIEDLLIREGFIELYEDESRTFPVTTRRDTERDDG